jgi:hypothetical protein
MAILKNYVMWVKNTTNGIYISQDGVRLSNYMFRPDILAIIRLQSLMLRGIQYA